MGKRKYTVDYLRQVAQQYQSLKEFREGAPPEFCASRSYGVLDEIMSHAPPTKRKGGRKRLDDNFDIAREAKVAELQSVGRAVSIGFTGGGMVSGDKTQVSTSKGMFVVHGTFQLIKGNEIVIEERESGSRYLCDHSQDICSKLVER